MRSRPGVGMWHAQTVAAGDGRAPTESAYPKGKASCHLPYTRRALLTFVSLELVIGYCFVFARVCVIPSHPLLSPVSYVLPVVISFALHRTLSVSALARYHGALAGIPAARMAALAKCDQCGWLRPPRTHHCSTCAQCTPRMSHHCGLLGVCIGGHNLKAFLLFLAYSLCGTAVMTACTLPVAVGTARAVWQHAVPLDWRLVAWFQAVYLQYSLTLVLTAVLAFHVRLVAANWTVLEAYFGGCLWTVVLPFGQPPPVSPFCLGARLRNVEQVFGRGAFALLPDAHLAPLLYGGRLPAAAQV